jgi:hypothetical protein
MPDLQPDSSLATEPFSIGLGNRTGDANLTGQDDEPDQSAILVLRKPGIPSRSLLDRRSDSSVI